MRNGNNCKWTCGMFRSESIDETTAIGLSYRVCSMGHSLQMIEKKSHRIQKRADFYEKTAIELCFRAVQWGISLQIIKKSPIAFR